MFVLGFGFDSVSSDYKILRVVFGRFSYVDYAFSVIVAELYSVNEDSWKKTKEMQGVCVDSGVLYFQGMDEILSFDLHNEVFGLYQYPNSGERASDVLDFDGSTAVILKTGGGGSVLSLWTLDDVGLNFSWTRNFNIEPDFKIDYVHLYLGGGQFLAQEFGVGYFFYGDTKKGNKKFPLLACFRECMSVTQFTGSLVSLKGFERRQ